MWKSVSITGVLGRQILDSRGRPTVEVEVVLSDNTRAVASVPSGASVGKYEALELRDGDPNSYAGFGVTQSVSNVNSEIACGLRGLSPFDQQTVDDTLISIDGTKNKSRLGANSMIGASLAVAKAAALSLGVPLYVHLGGMVAREMPTPLVNVINGGLHADNTLDFQEFMLVPIGAKTFRDAIRMCAEVFFSLKEVLRQKQYSTNTGDEGGFAPNIQTNTGVLDILLEAIERSGYRTTVDFALAMDVAASTFYDGSSYRFAGSSSTSEELVSYYKDIVGQYPIISIEDAMAEDDVSGWQMLTQALGDRVQLVGDDLFVTNCALISNGIEKKMANAVLIKPNQVGTLSETLDAVRVAQKNGYRAIVSHRSGETEDTSISHIAVAVNSGQIKAGSLSRSERLAKYNELLRIEESLGSAAVYHGIV